MGNLNSLAVYCGSNLGEDPLFLKRAIELGHLLAQKRIRLIYGGGSIGLMGTIADTMLENKGDVVGIIPQFLKNLEVEHQGLTELIVTEDMPTRRQKMMEMADGFIILPGGIGTFEEFFEAFSASQLKLHKKPIGLLNINDFYTPLLTFLEKVIAQKFMPKENLTLITTASTPSELLTRMIDFKPTYKTKHQPPSYLENRVTN